MAQKFASKIAWSTKTQSAFGTALEKTDVTKFVRLADPIPINENAQHWTDRGMVGNGHDWETERGIDKQWVRFDIPSQPLSVDFIGFLIAMFFGSETHSTVSGNVNKHEAKFLDLDTLSSAKVTTFAMYEDGNDYYVQDLAVASLTLRASQSGRLEAGASLVGSKIGGSYTEYSWPSSADSRPLYNFAGTYTRDTTDKKSELRSFELTLEQAINMDLAWQKVATEAARIYPSDWPFAGERSFSLSTSLLATADDLAAFRAAQQAGTEIALVLSCLGQLVTSSSPADYDEVEITVPKAVIDEVNYGFDQNRLHADLKMGGHYDTTGDLDSPIKITTYEGSAGEYLVEAS